MKIIAITGTLGAGKGVVVEYLMKNKGFKHYSAREFITKEILKRGLEVNRDSMTLVANDLRKNNSPSYIIEELFKEAQENENDAIIESVRCPGEIDALEKKENFTLLAVDADPKIRYERITSRKSSTDNVSFEKFLSDEEREMSDDPNKQNLKICISRAHYVLNNDTTIEDLYKQLETILEKLKNDSKSTNTLQ